MKVSKLKLQKESVCRFNISKNSPNGKMKDTTTWQNCSWNKSACSFCGAGC
ncbi:MAG: hypothetical protein ACEPOV_14360 [Hyphomicrobiales bacterium]